VNILEQIVEDKRSEIREHTLRLPVQALRERPDYHRSRFPLQTSIPANGSFSIIAEVKRSSPTAGTLRPLLDPAGLGRAYAANGAVGISVLTDGKHFGGSLDDLSAVRNAVQIPILRKDFIIDEYQLHEAKAFGADAVLLIASILDKQKLRDLHTTATALDLECLVELYETHEIDILDFDSMKLVGVNNRNLRTFDVDLARTVTMARLVPPHVTLVSESGICSSRHIQFLKDHGVHAALIGEHLVRSEYPGNTLRQLREGVTG
jgi:indole-3-glycerol phosphate synthase